MNDYTKFTKDPIVLSKIKKIELQNEECFLNYIKKPFLGKLFQNREDKVKEREYEAEVKNNLLDFRNWYYNYREEKESKRIKNLTQDFHEFSDNLRKVRLNNLKDNK